MTSLGRSEEGRGGPYSHLEWERPTTSPPPTSPSRRRSSSGTRGSSRGSGRTRSPSSSGAPSSRATRRTSVTARTQGIPIVRRFTAGGTVYNGPGNLNWSLFVAKGLGSGTLRYESSPHAIFRSASRPLLSALAASGVDAWLDPPNRILTKEGKISGMAAYVSRKGFLCHGTLLVGRGPRQGEGAHDPVPRGAREEVHEEPGREDRQRAAGRRFVYSHLRPHARRRDELGNREGVARRGGARAGERPPRGALRGRGLEPRRPLRRGATRWAQPRW